MTELILEAHQISFAHEGHQVLRDISLSVGPRHNLAIVGPNGSGKSSLLKCLAGIADPCQGRIHLKGRPLRSYRGQERAQLVSYLPQTMSSPFPYTVREFISLSRYPYQGCFRTRSNQDIAAVGAVLERLGLSSLHERSITELSGGERQKVLLASCLVQSTPILLLDEPTTFLDPHHQIEILDILRDERTRRDLAIVWVTHDINAASSYAERIIALHAGTVAFSGEAADFATDQRLFHLYGRRFSLVPHPSRDQVRLVVPEGEAL